MLARSLRHFRVFLVVADTGSPTKAADRCRVSLSAVNQALGKLEAEAGGPLLQRTRRGFFLTERGRVLHLRLGRAMGQLDVALSEVSARLVTTATTAQLRALIALAETQNYTLAARSLGLAQPTVHRAISHLERDSARPLFAKTAFGLVATRPCRDLAQAARLAFGEIEQLEAEMAAFDGRAVGRIVVGALPLSRSVVLPEALARFRAARPTQVVSVVDGPYAELLTGLRRGDIDCIIGALREPSPIKDVAQEPLFQDGLTIVARPGHPLIRPGQPDIAALSQQQWAVPRAGTPSRDLFDGLFTGRGLPLPQSILECGSILLMRELLARSDLLGCISSRQAEAELRTGLLIRLDTGIRWPTRRIGLTKRVGWVPTEAQAQFLQMIRDTSAALTEID